MPCCSKLVVNPTAMVPAMAFSGAGETVRPAAESWDRPLASSSSSTGGSPFVAVTTRLLAKASIFFEDRRARATGGTPLPLAVAAAQPPGATTVKLPAFPGTPSPDSPDSPAAVLVAETGVELLAALGGSGVAFE